MKGVLIDSGPLIALFDASDKYHQDAVDFIKRNEFKLVNTIATIDRDFSIYRIHGRKKFKTIMS